MSFNMARIGVSFDEISTAANEILSNGENPTIEKVRLKLGGRGSNSTISKYLNEWRNNSLPKKINNDINTTPPDPVNQAVSLVWKQIQEEKESEINAIKLELDDEIEKLSSEKQELEINFKQIIDERNDLISDNSELELSLKQIKSDLQNENEAHLITKSSLDNLQQQFDSWKQEKEKSINILKEEHQVAISNLKELYTSQENKYKTEINSIKSATEDLRHQHILEIDKLKIENTKLETKVQDIPALQELVSLNKDINNSLKANSELNQNHIEQYKTDHLNTINLIKASNFNVLELETKVDNISTYVNNNKNELEDVVNIIASLKNEIKNLKQEFIIQLNNTTKEN